jgi:hypothetical protein
MWPLPSRPAMAAGSNFPLFPLRSGAVGAGLRPAPTQRKLFSRRLDARVSHKPVQTKPRFRTDLRQINPVVVTGSITIRSEIVVIRGRSISLLAAPGFRFAQPGLRKKGKRNADRRLSPNLRAIRARLAPSGVRTSTGVPPRRLRQRPNATAQLQHVLPGTWLKDGRYPPPPVPVQRVHPRTGRNAGRTFSPEPPECKGDKPLPAGTALAPPAGVTGWRPFDERDSMVSSYLQPGHLSRAVTSAVTISTGRENRLPSYQETSWGNPARHAARGPLW